MDNLINYAVDLLYVIDAKKKILKSTKSIVSKIVFTETDLNDLRSILQEYISKKEDDLK